MRFRDFAFDRAKMLAGQRSSLRIITQMTA